MPDLWPDNFGTDGPQPPVVILREQAEHLSQRTGGLVLGNVSTQKLSDGNFGHRFILEVPTLDDYAFTLFTVTHPLFLYPLHLRSENIPGGMDGIRAETPERFEDVLRGFFAHPEVRKIVAVLIAQAMAAVGPANKP